MSTEERVTQLEQAFLTVTEILLNHSGQLDTQMDWLNQLGAAQAESENDSEETGAGASEATAGLPGDERASHKSKEAATTEASALRARYLEHLAGEIARRLRLENLSIVVDCANGAASELAPVLFERLGERVNAIHNAPDGRNINRDSGSLHMDELRRKVSELPGVKAVTVNVVWDPPWGPEMISPEGRKKLGMDMDE